MTLASPLTTTVDDNAAVGAVYNRNGQVSSGNARSQTTVNKAFLNLFIDKSGNVYDFKTSESGDRYNTKTYQTRCYSKLLTWSGVVCSAIFPPFLIATVPIAIVTQRKAKKKGKQFSKQPKSIARKTRAYRKVR